MTHTPSEQDAPGTEPIAAGRLLASLRLAIPQGALAMANKSATATLANGTVLTRDSAAPSMSGSGVLYAVAQVRLVDSERVRYQCAGSEWTYMIPSDIAAWLKPVAAPWQSQAGTGAMYAPCLIRPEDDNSMRVQVPGPALNRDWGAEWIHSGPCPKSAAGIIMAAMPKPTEDTVGVLAAEGKPAAPPPEPEDDDDTDDDDDNEDDN